MSHTYCDQHPDFGTCSEESQAHRDVANHLEHAHRRSRNA